MEPVFEKSRVGWSTRGARVSRPPPANLRTKERQLNVRSPLQVHYNYSPILTLLTSP